MICVARGFGKLLNSRKDVQEALSNYVSRVGEKLRQEKLCANMIQIFVQPNAHRSKPHPKEELKLINLSGLTFLNLVMMMVLQKRWNYF